MGEILDPKLSPREREILFLHGRGIPQKVIAGELGISVWTVRSHVRRSLAKLQANNVAHALTIVGRMDRKREIDRAMEWLRCLRCDVAGEGSARAILFCLIVASEPDWPKLGIPG